MTDYNFRVRALDSNGAFADRDFTITVRNTLVDRILLLDATNAYTSIAGASASWWTTRSGNAGTFVKHGGSQWIIFTNGSTIRTSPDAINWTNRTVSGLSSTGTIFHSAAYANGMWMAIWRTASSTVGAFTSTDGITWTQVGTIGVSTPASTVVRGLSYGNGRWFVGDTDSNVILGYYSLDNGATWTRTDSPTGNTVKIETSMYLGGRWITVDSSTTTNTGRSIISNNNMSTWVSYALPTGTLNSYFYLKPTNQIIYANGRLFVGCTTSYTAGSNLTAQMPMGYFTSDDGGLTWTARSIANISASYSMGQSAGNTTKIKFYNGVFHAFANFSGYNLNYSGQYCWSTDGTTWSTTTGVISAGLDIEVLSV